MSNENKVNNGDVTQSSVDDIKQYKQDIIDIDKDIEDFQKELEKEENPNAKQTIVGIIESLVNIKKGLQEYIDSNQPIETQDDSHDTQDATIEAQDDSNDTQDASIETQNDPNKTQDASLETQDDSNKTQDASIETLDDSNDIQDVSRISLQKDEIFNKIYIDLRSSKEGTFGIIYKGVDEEGNICAVKVPKIFDDDLSEKDIISRENSFNREIKITTSINHENIVSVYKSGETDDLVENMPGRYSMKCLVMEYAEEGTLEDYLNRFKTIDVFTAINITLQILDALIYLEKVAISLDDETGTKRSIGVVHRDIAPSNIILFDNHSKYKLCDFGLAKTWINIGKIKSDCSTDTTLRGHKGYRSYLQLKDYINPIPYFDLWGCIATLYHMLTGKKTRDARIEVEILHNGYKPVTSLADSNPDIFKGWNDGLKRELVDFVDGILAEEIHLEDNYGFSTAKDAKEKLEDIKKRYFDENGKQKPNIKDPIIVPTKVKEKTPKVKGDDNGDLNARKDLKRAGDNSDSKIEAKKVDAKRDENEAIKKGDIRKNEEGKVTSELKDKQEKTKEDSGSNYRIDKKTTYNPPNPPRPSTPPKTPTPPKNSKKTKGCVSGIFGLLLLIILIAIVIFAGFKMASCMGIGTDKTETTNHQVETEELTAKQVSYIKDKWLTQLEPGKIDEEVYIEDTETGISNTGKEYAHRMYAQSPYREVSFNLNGNYDRLKGVWYLCEDSADDENKNSFSIIADGIEVYKSPTVKSGELPHDLYVDIKNCRVLTVLFKDGVGALELGELKLTNYEKKEKSGNTNNDSNVIYPNWLTEENILQRSESINVEDDNYNHTNTGEVYSHYISADEPGTIEFFLDGKYETLTGLWGIEENSIEYVEKESFEIYADGKKVFTSSVLKKGSTPQKVFVMLHKCKKLRIKFTNTSAQAELGNLKVSP